MANKLIDIAGEKFGRLVPVRYIGNSIWECKCDCGKIVNVSGYSLRNNRKHSCGCNWRKGQKTPNLVNQRFGKLVVRSKDGHKYGSSVSWLCDCDCGNITSVVTHKLITGMTKSCGCGKGTLKSSSEDPYASRNYVYKSTVKGARVRNLVWEISRDTWTHLVMQNCFYCGAEPRVYGENDRSSKYGIFYCNGLDRIDNDRGYVLDNVVPCCTNCNYAKKSMTQQEYIDLCCNVARQHGSNKSGK